VQRSYYVNDANHLLDELDLVVIGIAAVASSSRRTITYSINPITISDPMADRPEQQVTRPCALAYCRTI
jgi:hypothetical protein